MDFPLFQNPWDASSNGRIVRSFRGIPVQVKPEAWPPRSFKPKTVSIPVRFVGSELSRSKSAINIQKVLRGFLVRKSVKKIMAIREQVNEMERSVSKTETVELIRKDSKERLRVNENLMRLLLKLDSVRGVDSCVRDLRKSVIKKAIALQEIVDAIISDDHSVDSSSAEAADQNQGIIDSSGDCNRTRELENLPNLSESGATVAAANQENEPETLETCRNESQSDSSADQENAVEEEGTWKPDNEKEGKGMNIVGKEESERKQMLEKIQEDNKKMTRFMEAVWERSELQTRMLRALAQRVGHLEKAYMCDKLRRKKRRNNDKCGGKR